MNKNLTTAAFFSLAITGAIASQQFADKKIAPQTGWIDAPSPCTISVVCSTNLGTVCTAIYQGQIRQAYGKVNPNDATCTKVLYRLQ
jgi:hypothetical protein